MGPLETYILLPVAALLGGGLLLAIVLTILEKSAEKKQREKISRALREPHQIFKILGWGLSGAKIEIPEKIELPEPPEKPEEEKQLPPLSLPSEESLEPSPPSVEQRPPAEHVLYLTSDFSEEKVKSVLEEKWKLQYLPPNPNIRGLLAQWSAPEGTVIQLFRDDEGKLFLEINGPQSDDLAQFLTYDLPVDNRQYS